MDTIEKLIQRIRKTQHGFLDIQKAADKVVAGHANKESLCISKSARASIITERWDAPYTPSQPLNMAGDARDDVCNPRGFSAALEMTESEIAQD